MYFVSGIKDGLIMITDTKDNVTESLEPVKVRELVQSGVTIRGIYRNNDGSMGCYCKGEDILYDFCNSVMAVLTRLDFLNITEREKRFKEIKTLAYNYGLSETMDDLRIDLDNKKLWFKNRKEIVQYGMSGEYKILDKDVSAKSIKGDNVNITANVKSFGSDAFDLITVPINGQEYKLSYLFNLVLEAYNVVSCYSYKDIYYIGYTPSNNMFKFVFGGGLFSIKFDSINYLINNYNKIISVKTNDYDFTNYCKKEYNRGSNPDRLVVVKFSRKEGRAYRSLDALHQKYSTLKDIYVLRKYFL